MYTPMLSPEHAERIRRWHENAYRQAGEHQRPVAGRETYDYLGHTIVVPAEVMPITPKSHLLGEAVLTEVRAGDRVLDMGTGSGVNAVLAASKSTDVIALDVNPHALDAARDNAARNGVAERIDVRESDVFAAVPGERFDLIVFDPPFRWFAPRTLLEVATTDENYRTMTTFFRQARDHLTPGGRMLIFFGTTGDLAYLRSLADQHRFAVEEIAHDDLLRDGWTVDYYTFRMTPA